MAVVIEVLDRAMLQEHCGNFVPRLKIPLNEIPITNTTEFQLNNRLSLLHLDMLIFQNLVDVAAQLYDGSLSQFSGINHLVTFVSGVQSSALAPVLLVTAERWQLKAILLPW
jgi:hypothetical protein